MTSRRHEGKLSAENMLLLFGAGLLSVVFTLHTLGRVDQLALLWPVSGVELALLLPCWRMSRRQRWYSQAAGCLGVLIGGLLVGMPGWLATQIALLTGIDVCVAGAILSVGVQGFEDLKRRKNVLRFGVATTLVPVATGVLGALPVSHFLRQPVLKTAMISISGNSLGMALVTPAVLFLMSGEYRSMNKLAPYMKRGALSLLLFVIVVALVFWQNAGPFLFVIFPPMVIVLLVLGLEGAIFTSAIVSAIGWAATSQGHGPLWLMREATPEHRLFVLQLFVWVCVATALPVGALLDERRRAERHAGEGRSIYQTLLQHAEDMIILSSLEGSRRYVSPAVERLTGWTPDEYLALDRLATIHPADQEIGTTLLESLENGKREHSVRYRLMQKDGSWRWVEAIVRAYGDASGSRIAGYVSTVRDISALKQSEDTWVEERTTLTLDRERILDLASTDPLTGLLNRRSFDQAMQRYQETTDKSLAMMMIDVDYFKLYNDTYGHHAGDECLRQLAQVLQARVRRVGDLVARLGGEEFVVVLSGADLVGAQAVAEQILNVIRALSIEHKGSPLEMVTVSVGVAAWDSGVTLDAVLLLQQADRALYESKRTGKNRVSVSEL